MSVNSDGANLGLPTTCLIIIVFLLGLLQHSQISAITLVRTMLFFTSRIDGQNYENNNNLYETIILL